MAMKTSNTNIELSNDIKISDSVVKAVVEKFYPLHNRMRF